MRSPVLARIAARYQNSRAARTGSGKRDFPIVCKVLLREAGAQYGEAKEIALHDLNACEQAGLLELERSRRDPTLIERVRLPLNRAEDFLAYCELQSPATGRESLAAVFERAANAEVPTQWRENWKLCCRDLAAAARQGRSTDPFDRNNPTLTAQQLQCAARLLAWSGESYLRFASTILCGNSKSLAQWQPRIERFLSTVTQGEIASLAALGITETGGGCWLHGPGELQLTGGSVPLNATTLPIHCSRTDLLNSTIISPAPRWLTVENETMLIELARVRADVLLLSSGFRGGMANTAVVELLRRAPADAELWHFGDSDPQGFEILRDLRSRSGREIRSLAMHHRPADPAIPLSTAEQKSAASLSRNSLMQAVEMAALQAMLDRDDKGHFEQESLGVPTLSGWPFYNW